MSPERHHAVARLLVRSAAVIVPPGLRHDWTCEWNAELAALGDLPLRYRRPVRRALGAFADAFWLRQRSIADFHWIDDVRHGLRQVIGHGGFALTAVAILSLGLAATVTMFCVADQILLRPLPYPQADRIVTLWQTRADQAEPLEVAPGDFLDWRARAQSFEYLAGVDPWALDVHAGARPEVWFSAKVTQGFFESFGVEPLVGRFFSPDEYQTGRDNVVVLTEGFWRQRFGSDASVIGRSFRTDDGPVTVVGVVPASFEPRLLATATGYRNVWQPKAIQQYEPGVRGGGYWAVVGRLKPGVTLEGAQAEMTAISRQLAQEYPRTNAPIGARVMPLREYLVGDVRLAVALLAGAVTLVLLIACVNVANLLLARGSAREREIAIRVALGARRPRILQQLLIETLVIAGFAATVATLIAYWVLLALAGLGPSSVPWIETLHLDWRALVFAVLVAIAVAVLSGMLPAWRVARAGLMNAGRQTATSDRSQHRLRAGLVVVEVAIALVLITGAGLLMRSFISLMRVDPGFQRANILVTQVFAWDYNPRPEDLRRFFDEAILQLRGLPAVQAVGAVSAMPFIESNINIQRSVTIVNRPLPTQTEAPRVFTTIATPGYFEAMRIPLRAGRHLSDHDGAKTKRVAVISDTFARRFWSSDAEAIGERLQVPISGKPAEIEIVGVIASLRHDALDRSARPELFMPFAQVPFGSMTFVIRSAGDASQLLEPVKSIIWSISPNQTIYRTATLDELVIKTVSPRRFSLIVILSFASIALLLAIAGVYGVLSAITTARLREVGVRVALGASRWDIVRLVVRRGLAMASVGLALGIAGSLGAARLLRSFLFQITPADPIAVVASAGLMSVAALAACYLPARRAAAADPVLVLRAE